MVYIQKTSSPPELIQAKRDGLKDYSNMDTATKDAIKQHLFQEQHGLCAYCMRKLKPDTMQIEHYEAQNPADGEPDLDKTIDYQNMLGVCPGEKGTARKECDLTCDQHRKNIPLTVNPLDIKTIDTIKYSPSTGKICSSNIAINDDLDKTLNLNCSAARLCENRKAVLDSFQNWVKKHYPNRSLSKEKWKALELQISTYACEQPIEYFGIIQWYIHKKIR